MRMLRAGAVIGGVVAAGALALAGCTVDPAPAPPPAPVIAPGPAVAPAPPPTPPPRPTPSRTAKPSKAADANHCRDPKWWSRQGGDPGAYVAKCGHWPSWVDRGDTACVPGERNCPVSKRTAPQYGYQCRDGDEATYSVCAGHKAWTDGQVEYANCLSSGGTWNIDAQRCDRKR